MVLVHGYTASPTSWRYMDQSNLLVWDMGLTGPVPTTLHYVDYSSTNIQGLAENMPALVSTLRHTMKTYRSPGFERLGVDSPYSYSAYLGLKRYATTRVDVVGHSMGGLITRAYISNVNGIHTRGSSFNQADFGLRPDDGADPKRRYKRKDNFYSGDIRRLITLGSPLRGSPSANVGQYIDPVLSKTAKLARLGAFGPNGIFWPNDESLGIGATHTALPDLTSQNDVRAAVVAARPRATRSLVPWHAVAGRAENLYLAPWALQPNAFAWNQLSMEYQLSDFRVMGVGFGSAANSDLVVPLDSALNSAAPNDANRSAGKILNFHIHGAAVSTLTGLRGLNVSVPLREWVIQQLSKPRAEFREGDLFQ